MRKRKEANIGPYRVSWTMTIFVFSVEKPICLENICIGRKFLIEIHRSKARQVRFFHCLDRTATAYLLLRGQKCHDHIFTSSHTHPQSTEHDFSFKHIW